jgi:hypothetical protein
MIHSRHPVPPSPHGSRIFPLLLALGTTIVCAACWWWPDLMSLAGVGHGGEWFRDTKSVLSALAGYRNGLDPYAAGNPSAQHLYSHWWFWLAPTGLRHADGNWLGAIVSGLALVTVWLVARPRNARELTWTLAVFCAPAILLGLNRANVDLLFFALLSLCIPALRSRFRWLRLAGAPALIALGTGLKYYPAVAGLVLLAVRPPRERRLVLLVYAVLIGLTLVSVAPDVRHYASFEQKPGFYTFGLPALAQLWGGPARAIVLGLLLASAIMPVIQTSLRRWSRPAALSDEYLNFMVGAVILTGCYVLALNYAYRWIFAFWLLPFLCRLPAFPAEPTICRLRQITLGLLALTLWIEPVVVIGLNMVVHTDVTNQQWQHATVSVVQGVNALLFACLSAWIGQFIITQLRAAPEPLPLERVQ